MRASHITLLSLAASTAAPVFAAPISYLNARFEDGGAALSARDSRGGCAESTSENHTSQPHSDNPGEFIARDSVDDFITAIANMNTRRSDDVERNVPRDVTPESLAARLTSDDSLAAMLSDRSLSSGQDIQARGLFDLFKVGLTLLSNFRRDVTPDELAARGNWEDMAEMLNTRRDAVDDLLSTLSNHATREPSPDAPKTVARDGSTENAFMSALLNSRDSLMGELAGRDAFDDLLNSYMSDHDAREPSPQQETQARSVSDGAPETVARDGSTENAFISALLNSRDSLMGELSGRDAFDDLLNSYMSNHDAREPSSQQETQARSVSDGAPKTVARDGTGSTTNAFIKALLNSRDSSMPSGELAGRDAVDDFIHSYMSNHDTREPIPEQETQARSMPDDAPETVARDFNTDPVGTLMRSLFFLNGRDVTPDDVLSLASLASRALDNLD